MQHYIIQYFLMLGWEIGATVTFFLVCRDFDRNFPELTLKIKIIAAVWVGILWPLYLIRGILTFIFVLPVMLYKIFSK